MKSKNRISKAKLLLVLLGALAITGLSSCVAPPPPPGLPGPGPGLPKPPGLPGLPPLPF